MLLGGGGSVWRSWWGWVLAGMLARTQRREAFSRRWWFRYPTES